MLILFDRLVYIYKNIRMHGSDEGIKPKHDKTKMAPVLV